METLRRHKYAILLAVLVCAAFVDSFPHRLVLGPHLSDLFLATTLLLVFLIVFDRRVNRAVAFFALTIALSAHWAHFAVPESRQVPLELVYYVALLLLYGFAACVILRNIFQQSLVHTDDVLGAVCGYLLAAGAWANIFALAEAFSPGSFSLGTGFEGTLDTWHGRIAVFDYVSLGALTSIGSGDVAAVRAPATVLVILETVFGQFYIAVVVAQLVGVKLAQATGRRDYS